MITYIFEQGLTGDGAPYSLGTYSLAAVTCFGFSGCEQRADVEGLEFVVTKEDLDCPVPPTDGCESCTSNRTVGAGSTGVRGPLCATPPDSGGDVTFRAATRVVLKDGFVVEAGGSFTAGTDPSLSGDVTRTYQYQDVEYFLTDASGPWGARTWTFDKIGNRLTETDTHGTDFYDYMPNGAGGNTALLQSIDQPTLTTRTYAYSPAGHQTRVAAGANVVDFRFDDAGRMSQADRTGADPVPWRNGFLLHPMVLLDDETALVALGAIKRVIELGGKGDPRADTLSQGNDERASEMFDNEADLHLSVESFDVTSTAGSSHEAPTASQATSGALHSALNEPAASAFSRLPEACPHPSGHKSAHPDSP